MSNRLLYQHPRVFFIEYLEVLRYNLRLLKMEFHLRFITIIFISFFTFSTALFAQNNATTFTTIGKDVDSIVVKDLSNNKTIYAKGDNKLMRPASLTKIMTCMLAIESGKMENIVTITRPMINVEPTILNLKVGDKIKLKDLVHAAMIKSANDAAYAIAYYLGKNDEAKFISMMNQKAKKLGMKNTNFQNPCGFDHNKHKSTARDLMKLAEYAIKNKTFNAIVKLNKYSFTATNSKKRFSVYTSNILQRGNKNVVGLKTGYTRGAGPCLIARAKKDNKDILFVMLNASNRWNNAKIVLDTTMKNPEKKIKKAA